MLEQWTLRKSGQPVILISYIISPLNHIMNIILGVILWSLKKFSRNDRGKMFTALPRRTRTYGENNRDMNKHRHPGIGWNQHQNSDIILKKCISTYYAPDDKGYFKIMREAEDGKAKEGKHTCFWKDTHKENIALRTSNKIFFLKKGKLV